MTKIKEFLSAHKEQVIVALGGVSAFLVALEGLGGTTATIVAIIATVVSLLTYFVKNGLDETFANMLASAGAALLQMMIKLISEKTATTEETTTDETEEVVTASAEKPISKMSKEELKKELLSLMEE